MTGRPGAAGRQDEVEALVADRYLDALLAAAERHASDTPSDAALPPELREAAAVLRRALVRVHPSFRFEERLAGRLAELAAAPPDPAAADRGGAILGWPTPPDAPPEAAERPAPSRRPLLLGGALTSAAISLVGVAWVAWRATRSPVMPPATAMGRAARVAHARRTLAAAGAAPGPGPRIGGPA